ncbi:MAG: cadherin-like beta sandwich domain-containing protein, partial [Akkermansiaceae bacterium]|nr:cadherin-like beta sandwich domain-containing protein [Akkermansiaceae bacterium]
GENLITVTVIALDGTITEYHLTVVRQVPMSFAFTSATTVPITADEYTAAGNTVDLRLEFAPPTGTTLTVIENTGKGLIAGQFANLAHGHPVFLTYNNARYQFIANYYGGTGNDLVLQWARQRIYAWGSNSKGQYGNDLQTQGDVPVPVEPSGALAGKTVIALARGGSHSLALCADGSLVAWGAGDEGQLGDNRFTSGSMPVAVAMDRALAGKKVIAIAAGGSQNLALCADGTLVTWGNGSKAGGRNQPAVGGVPVEVPRSGVLAGKTVVAIAAGYYHSLALCADGTLAAWGQNSSGQLANGSTADSAVPVAVKATGALAGKTISTIAAGGIHNLALCADGSLVAWGGNGSGQLGIGTATSSVGVLPTAVDISGVLAGKEIAAIAAGSSHCLVRCSDGTLAAWGDNGGSLGNGSLDRSPVPIDITHSGILAGKTVTAIAGGINHSLALCTDGTVAAWGTGSSGVLGTGVSISTSLVPIAVDTSGVLAGKTIVTLCAGYTHSAALCADGTLATWGNNHGAAGTSYSLAPTAVSTVAMGSGERFTALAAGSSAYHLVTVAAAPDSANSRLAALTLNPGTATPAFSPGTTAYTAKVPAGTTILTVTPTAMAAGATIEVNGVAVASGTPSGSLTCAALPVTHTVKVTARDGLDSTIYQLMVANAAPVFPGYEVATPYHTPAILPLRKVLANAVDPDGDALAVTTAGPSSAAGGTVVLLADSIRYTPPDNISGLDSFLITITDAAGANVTNYVLVTVGPAPNAGEVGANPPMLTVLPGGKMGIAFQGIPGRTYLVQRSGGGLDDWVTLATITANASGKVSYIDESPPPGSAFYRLGLP